MKNLAIGYLRWGMLCMAVSVMCYLFQACSGEPHPKDTVMDFFSAMHNDSTARVYECVDLERAWASVRDDLTQPDDSLLTEIPWGERLAASLTGEGNLRTRWMKMQIVINKTEFIGDSATVEVSFIDRETRMHYYNKMGLVRRANRWVIVAFRTI